MAHRGPDAADVRRQVSILSLLPAGQVARQTARNRWVTLCTFHEDARPSMSVSIVDGLGWVFNCFACGERGDVIGYVMKRDRCSFKEAMVRIGEGVSRLTPPPPPPKSDWLLVCDGSKCPHTLPVKDVAALAFLYQKGWRLDEDGRAWCGWCVERAWRRHTGMGEQRRAA
jgi:hypothetical protein